MRLPLLLCLTLALSAPLHAQITEPSEQIATIRANANLVVVDVVVTDKDGKPVKGLKQSDFTLEESKTPQNLRHFEEHIALPDNTPAAPLPKLEPGVFTNVTPATQNSAINVILLDALNTPMQDQSFVRNQLLQYLKSAHPGTRIAIFGLRSRLIMLQGFTSDTDLLRRIVERQGASASPVLDDKVSGQRSVADDQLSDVYTQMAAVSQGMAQAVAEFNSTEKSIDTSMRARYTLDALNQLARYLTGIPGRKNLIWFSGSFPISILPDANSPLPFAGTISFADELHETSVLLTRSQVAVYPVDARGLMVSPMLNASNPGTEFTRGNPINMVRAQQNFSATTFDEHSTMFTLAEDTGGKAFVNTNGLAQAVDRAIHEGSNYYTLAYAPSNNHQHGEYRSIQIKLPQSDYVLAYRRGYYADPAPRPIPTSAAPRIVSRDAVKAAALRGAPPATQLSLYAKILPGSGAPEQLVAPGNDLVPRNAQQKGPFRRYAVQYSIDAQALALALPSPADGLHRGTLEFITLLFDAEGTVINSVVKTEHPAWNQTQWTPILQQGVRYQQVISIPEQGSYTLRILVHDQDNGRIGSVELPVDSIKHLHALAAPSNTPAKPH